jgi:hypothetical protein
MVSWITFLTSLPTSSWMKFIHECPFFIHIDELHPLLIHNVIKRDPKKIPLFFLKYLRYFEIY